ncbi:nucleoside-diphosphate-sugar epimerase [Chromohalobacter marismortui]|uniref:Nucleoside-diphosphate-sugar epimerase n=1 Tax=Chromohalobacter marismortui TaxID=42055 RepID=A0A4R7NCP2_9GAMM|nr:MULTISPECIES: D-erythronate dehydrogenase [Chromohalobacter]MCI0509885.1 SDR family oxidoreductase [Chromohalobacter sp.]MCI0591993.1 SDR family oxidoreductase [Chromohalobacter sp.]TDU18174.1 nucleoside-diphosphate-sugar epimerase [Chromohalobacter marismortui]
MQVIVTGGAGFLGARLIQTLLEGGRRIEGETITRVTSIDLAPCPLDDPRVESWVGDVADKALIERALKDDTLAVCHLAAVVSSQAEADFELGMRVNLEATQALLDVCRAHPRRLRFLFASSLAVFGPGLAQPVPEETGPQPRSSYGAQKAIGELLVNDYSRRGFIDGRVCRLPTIVARPGKPNQAASSFASSIIREPLAGQRAVCPVDPDLPLWLSSPRAVVGNLCHALQLGGGALDEWRTLNLPGITVTVAQLLGALERQAGAETRALVDFEPDAAIDKIVASWPGGLDIERPLSLGFQADADVDAVIHAYREDYLNT